MGDGCAFDENQTFMVKPVVQVMGLPLIKYCLEGITKDLLIFLAPNIIFIGQLEKDIGLHSCVAQCLSSADQVQ